jgi:hypothetical protein
VKNPVSKFAFQVHNLQRYIEVFSLSAAARASCFSPSSPSDASDQPPPPAPDANAVGLCTLNQVYPYPITYNLSNP